MCNSDETLKLSDNVKMETWELQYFAFENRIDFSEDSMYISSKPTSFLWDIGEQNSPRCDAAKRGVPPWAILFAYIFLSKNEIRMKKSS